MQSSASVNLVKRKANLLDEIIRWALNVGRLLIIITEIAAFSAFIYRFSLDRTIIDLHSKIKQEQAIVESLKDREEIYRNLQERILSASIYNSTGDRRVRILEDIIGFTPPEISFNTFSIENDDIKIDLNISSISSLNAFVETLRSYPQISSVTINSISNNNEKNTVNVTLSAKLKKLL